MEDSSKYSGINMTFYLICCMFWIFSPTEGNTILEEVGSKVILYCKNTSISMPSQLTWKMNRYILFSFHLQKPLHVNEEALRLNIHMSLSESQLYALVIERVQKSHTGNYTCETITNTGTWEKNWELIITDGEKAENWDILVIAVAATVPCLIFIIVLIILQRVYKRRAGNCIHCPTAEMQEQIGDIYENCLENYANQRCGYIQPYH